MITEDDKELSKYISYNIIIPPLDYEKWESYFTEIINTIFEQENYTDYTLYHDEYRVALYRCINLIRPLLQTPRLIKTFGRHLQNKLKSPSRYINFIDLILLTTIQTTNSRLYLWIAESRLKFVDKNTTGNEIWKNNYSGKEIDELANTDSGIQNKIKEELGNLKICSEPERAIVTAIFFNDSNIYNTNYNFNYSKGEIKLTENRVTQNYYFCHYFFREELPFIATPDGLANLIDLLNNKNISYKEISDELFHQYDLIKRSDMKDLFFLTILQLLDKDETINLEFKIKLIISTAIMMKITKYQKWQDLNPLINKIISNIGDEDDKIKTLKSLLENDIKDQIKYSLIYRLSDASANNIKQYFTKKTSIDEIKKFYNDLCRELCYDGKKPRNIFKNNYTESPQYFLGAWVHSGGRETTTEYIERLIKQEPDAINDFLRPLSGYPDNEIFKNIDFKIPLQRFALLLEKYSDSIDKNDQDLIALTETIQNHATNNHEMI